MYMATGRLTKASTATSITLQPKSDGSDGIDVKVDKPKIDNKTKHATNSSKQPGKNSDPRSK